MFGQVVIGPPGSGKSTLCAAITALMRAQGREICVVNLDPANDDLPYVCDVDVADLVSLDAVQERLSLGPNGGLLYCIEYLEQNLDWLQERIQPFLADGRHVIFDCPGQAELFMCHDAFSSILATMTREWHLNLVILQLIDSHLCATAPKTLAALLMCLSSMLHLELPHINVMSKADLLAQLSEGPLDVEQLTDVAYVRRQLRMDVSAFSQRFAELTDNLCDVVENYSLVGMLPVAVRDAATLQNLLDLADKANGFAYSGLRAPIAST